MISISKLLGRTQPPGTYENWFEAVIPEFIYLHEGRPAHPDADTLKKWKKSFARWQAGYDGFRAIERSLQRRGRPMQERDRRSCDHFTTLLLTSALWHALLLLAVNDVTEPERSRLLAEIDQASAELTNRIKNR